MAIDASVRSRWIQAIAIAGMILLAVPLLLPAVQQSREAARRTQPRNNLKQIGLALDNYHDTHQRWPSGGTFDQNGRGMHGWGIALYPYLEASPLYNMVDFKQAWDAPYNAGDFSIQLSVFQNPSIETTVAFGRKREFALCHYAANSNLLAANSAIKPSAIESPIATFVIGEVGGNFVPWGCPYNWRPLQNLTEAPGPFGRITNIGGHFLMADCSVRWIAPDVSEEVLSRLRGSNLAGDEAERLQIKRPRSFPYPTDARDPWMDLKSQN